MLLIPKISVIITTHKRYKNLVIVIEHLMRQTIIDKIEKICVSDGYDEEVEAICSYYKLNYFYCDKQENHGSSKGHLARDTGIEKATSEYLCLWDDDNYYYADAAQNLLESVGNNDIGICDILFKKLSPQENKKYSRQINSKDIYRKIPDMWNGSFVLRQIDTMNVVVRTNLAKKEKWSHIDLYEGDFYWLNNLMKYNPIISYSQKTIGIKL